MKKLIYVLSISMLLLAMGCGHVEPNPYELTKEAREEMKPDQQKEYIELIKSLEELVTNLNNENLSTNEAQALIADIYKNLPKDYKEEEDHTPLTHAWHFFMAMREGITGCDKYDNYADCKDSIDKMGEELANYFTQSNDRRKALIVSEDRFYDLYAAGKALIEE